MCCHAIAATATATARVVPRWWQLLVVQTVWCAAHAAAECANICLGSTCDSIGASTGVSCDALEGLFNCDCSDCTCIEDETFDPQACVDIPGFEDSRGYSCADYTADDALCADAQSFIVPGMLAATEACCVCVPGQAEYLIPVALQHVVVGDAERPELVSSSVAGSSASLDDACWLVNTTAIDGAGAITNISLFGQSYSSAYVCSNGIISFGAAELGYNPTPFPSSSTPIIAPFWADIDVRCGSSTTLRAQSGCGGGSFYWQFITAQSNLSQYVSAMDRRVRQLYDPSFEAESLFVATWDAVGYHSLQTDALNSFQAAVATAADGSGDTYTCFYYKDLQWVSGAFASDGYAQMGFDAGDGEHFYSHPTSFTEDIGASLMTGVPFCYRLSSIEICPEGSEYVNSSCAPMSCNNYASGLFADRYLATDCELPVRSGDTCALTCEAGKVALSDASMTATCSYGTFLDPGPSCTEPGIAVVPSRLFMLEGMTSGFAVSMLSSVLPGLPIALVPNITFASSSAYNGLAGDFVVLTTGTGELLDSIVFDASNFGETVGINVSAVNDVVVRDTLSIRIDFEVVSLDPGYVGYSPDPVLVSIEDNDFAAVIVDSQGTLQVQELDTADGEAACDVSTTSVSYSLSSQPAADVLLTIALTDDDLGSICSRSTLVFTNSDWDTPQEVTFAAIPNSVDDDALFAPSQPIIEVIGSVISEDPNYNKVDVASTQILFINDDVSGITIAEAGVIQAVEGDVGAVVDLLLESEPQGSVFVNATINDTVNCEIVSGASLIFDARTWDVQQYIEVAAVEDDIVDDSIVCGVDLQVSANEDAAYNSVVLDNPAALVHKVDNDFAAFDVETVGGQQLLATPEGGTALFSILLSAQPAVDLVFGFDIQGWDATISGGAPVVNNGSNYTLSASSWNDQENYVVLRCSDNLKFETAVVNGTDTVLNATLFELRVFLLDSQDSAFANLPDAFLTGYCEDNDIFGVTVASTSANSDATHEHDIQGTVLLESSSDVQLSFSLFFLSVPTHDISASCDIVSTNGSFAGNSAPVQFEWTSTNVISAQSTSILDTHLDFTIRARDDDIDSGSSNTPFCVACHLSSMDSHYDGLYREFVCGAVIDDDVAGVVMSPTSIITSERDMSENQTHAITVSLQSQPLGPVVVSATVSAASAAVIVGGTETLEFSVDNWNIAQTVLVQGVDDWVCELESQTYSVVLSSSSQVDSLYNSLSSLAVLATNVDDDVASILFSLNGGVNGLVTSESPVATANLEPPTAHVVLTSQPAAPVYVQMSSSDATEALVSPTNLLVFDPSDWNVTQSVSILGVDDNWIDGDQTFHIRAVAASDDTMYDAINSVSGNLVNIDDNIASIEGPQSLASGSCVTSEDSLTLGQPLLIPVQLSSSPSDGVYLNEAAAGISATNGPGLINSASVFIDEDHTPSEWTSSPTGDLASCSDGSMYVTIDLGEEYWVTSVVIWHYYEDIRQYCSQSVLLSRTGSFSGEEVDVYNTGTGYGPVETAAGHEIVFNATAARYIRHHCGRSTLNTGIHFMEMDIFGFAPVAVTVTSSDASVGVVGRQVDGAQEGTVSYSQSIDLTFDAESWDTPQYVALVGVDNWIQDGNQDFTLQFTTSSSGDPYYGSGTTSFPSTSTAVATSITCVNEDDDVAALKLRAGVDPLQTSESATDSLHVVPLNVSLNSEPTSTVVVQGWSNDTTEATISQPDFVYFDADNWFTPQILLLTGVDDVVVDGPVVYEVGISVLVSGDSNYANVQSASLVARNLDNDVATVTASITSTSQYPAPTTEGGDIVQTLHVALSSKPTADVIVSVSVSESDEAELSLSELVIIPSSWTAGSDIVVRGLDDFVEDGNVDFSVTFSVSSDDPLFDGVGVAPIHMVNLDDDHAGVVVENNFDLTFESGQHFADAYVWLATRPDNDVVVAVESGNPQEGMVLPIQLTFNNSNWNVSQSVVVQGVDDDFVDGDQVYNVTFSSSGDNVYAGLPPHVVSFVNIDDDEAGVLVSRPTDCTSLFEASGSCLLSMQLQSQPLQEVSVRVASSNILQMGIALRDGVVGVTTVNFTASQWNVPQDILVVAIDNSVRDGTREVNATFDCVSDDSTYNSLSTSTARYFILDDDYASVTVECVEADTFACDVTSCGPFSCIGVLDAAPSGNVNVNLRMCGPSGTSEILFFDDANWNISQAVSVFGLTCSTGNSAIGNAVTVSVDSALDIAFDAVDDFLVDAGAAGTGIDLWPTASLVTTEQGGTANTTIRLKSEPTGLVSVGIQLSDSSKGAIMAPSSSTVQFSQFNWSTPVSVVVVGQDDVFVNVDSTYQIFFQSTSNDALYQGRTATLLLENVDDDLAQIFVDVVSSNSTSAVRTMESGSSFVGRVQLLACPRSWVEVSVSVSDPSEARVNITSANFTLDNWSPNGIPFQVFGVDDYMDDGAIGYSVDFQVSRTSSEDTDTFLSATSFSLAATNEDDDETKVLVNSASVFVDESGTSQSVSVALASEPYADVTVAVASDDTSEVMLEGAAAVTGILTLTFTPENWQTPQMIVIAGVPDNVVDGDQVVGVQVVAQQVGGAGPTSYDGITVPVTCTNTDVDEGGAYVVLVNDNLPVASESGDIFLVALYLASRPLGAVEVSASVDDETEAFVVPSGTITVQPEDWNTPTVFTVGAIDDTFDDGDTQFSMSFDVSCSDDENFDGAVVDDVEAIIIDNDLSGISLVADGDATSENGEPTVVVRVKLQSQPYVSHVVVPINSSDWTEGIANLTTLTFTADNWNIEQGVLVTGVDDSIPDGTIAYSLQAGPAVASDSESPYNDVRSSFALVNLDNDIADLVVTVPTTAAEVFEALAHSPHQVGGAFNYTVRLDSQPNANVTVSVVAESSRVKVIQDTLTFHENNWDVDQTVVITAIDNIVDDGEAVVTISHVVASVDERFLVLPPPSVDVVVINDDIAAIDASIATSSPHLSTSEDGDLVVLDVKLTTPPTMFETVLVSVASSDTTEAQVELSSLFLFFTSMDFNQSQQITVVGVDDAVIDGNIEFDVEFVTDGYGHGGTAAMSQVPLFNVDNDAMEILVSKSNGGNRFITSEKDGGQFNAIVSLSAAPDANESLVVYVTSADESEVLLCRADDQNCAEPRYYQSLEFTKSNWEDGVSIYLLGVDDDVADGDQAVNVTFTLVDEAFSSAETIFTVTNEDDDFAAIIVDANFDEGIVSEFGPALTFTVRLATEPVATVDITCSSDQPQLGFVEDPANGVLTFTSSNWLEPQEVAVLATETEEAALDTPFVISCSVASDDTVYDAFDGTQPEPLTFVREDLTIAGFATYTRGYSTSESGREILWFVRTLSPPTSTVLVKAAASPSSEAKVSPDRVAIKTNDWESYHELSIVGKDDDIDDGDQIFSVLFDVATQDEVYATKSLSTLQFSNQDNDESGVAASLVSPVVDTVREAEPTSGQSFTIVLESEPIAPVHVVTSASDMSAGFVQPSAHTFTASNWDTKATFTVYPSVNDVQDGNREFSVVVSFNSTDSNYAPPLSPNISFPFTAIDDDRAGLFQSHSTFRLAEGESSTTWIALESEPTAPVLLTFVSLDESEVGFKSTVDATPSVYVLDASNWSLGVNASIFGIVDNVDDGDQATSFSVICSSADPLYANLTANSTVEIVDIDAAGLVSSLSSDVHDVSENGTSTDFFIRLGTAPTAPVSVTLSISDETECAFEFDSSLIDFYFNSAIEVVLTFNSSTWLTQRWVTIRGVDDFIDDGNQQCHVVVKSVESADQVYNTLLDDGASGVSGDTLYIILNWDDDEAGAELTPLALVVSESDTTVQPPIVHTASIVLLSEPAEPPVRIVYNSSNPAEVLCQGTVEFDATNWNIPQELTVVAVNDDRVDGDSVAIVSFSEAVSEGSDYDGS